MGAPIGAGQISRENLYCSFLQRMVIISLEVFVCVSVSRADAVNQLLIYSKLIILDKKLLIAD